MKLKLLLLLQIFALLAQANAGPDDLKPDSIEYEIAVQRATQAAIWAMPAVGMVDFIVGIRRDLGGDLNDVVYMSKPFVSRHGFLTPNNQVPYVFSNMSTKDGPIVVDVPGESDKAIFFGTFVDAWQTPIEDVGPTGADKGKGAKYLFLPPGYHEPIPDGFLVYRPRTLSVNFVFRPVSKKGGTIEDAVEYAKSLKVYNLADADNPPATHFIDGFEKKFSTLPTYDITFFADLNLVIQSEPVLERDKAMMGMLAGLGIKKGEPFEPGPVMTKALEEGLAKAYEYMQSAFVTPGVGLRQMWDSSQWSTFNIIEEQAKAGFPMETEDQILVDERAVSIYFWATYMPKVLGGGSFYLMGLRDDNGKLLSGEATYKLNVPNDTPARDFWSAIVYSMNSKGFIEDVPRVGISSLDKENLDVNADGSVDIYFSPDAPKGNEANWLKTGEDFFLIFRLYGPEKELNDGSWKLNEIEFVE